MDHQGFYRVSVKGIVYDEAGRILLAREGDRWELLGGGLDHGEDPRQCLMREIAEETGLMVTSVSARPRYFLTAPKPGKDFQVANIIYEVTLQNLDFHPTEECQELRYFSIEEMGQVNLYFNVQKLLEVMLDESEDAAR